MKESNFAFSVEVFGFQWDVYRFTKDDKNGMLAFKQIPNGKWEIGFMKEGEFTPDQIEEILKQDNN